MSQRESYLIFLRYLVKNGTIVIFLTFREISGFTHIMRRDTIHRPAEVGLKFESAHLIFLYIRIPFGKRRVSFISGNVNNEKIDIIFSHRFIIGM